MTRSPLIKEENEGAFTLIELLVVILIIGILAAIAIPVFLNQRKAAVDASVISDVKNAATQVETWSASHPNKAIPGFLLRPSDAGGSHVVDWGTTTTTERDDALANSIKLSSPNTRLTVTPYPTSTNNAATPDTSKQGAYTIKGTNEKGGSNRTNSTGAIVYDSIQGGLTPGTVPPAKP